MATTRREWLRQGASWTAAALGAGLWPVGQARGEVTADEVQQRIEGGRRYLVKFQHPTQGSWDEHPGQNLGMSAICTLALINAGQPLDSPAILRALANLRSNEPSERTYAKSLRLMALAAAGDPRDMPLIIQDAEWLEAAQQRTGERQGGWGYSKTEGRGDHSNTQFAILALHEAEQAGVKIDPEVWRLAQEYWVRSQNKDGSWNYSVADQALPPSGSMTCAGIASLIITEGRLRDPDAEVVGEQASCCGAGSDTADRIERALTFLGRPGFFTLEANPGGGTYWLYYLYALERVGRMNGRRLIGGRDWYREGAEMLVKRSSPLADGAYAWRGIGGAEGQSQILATAFALLFLSKGRRPVVIAKLRHGEDARDWDRHRSAINNLVMQVERRWRGLRALDGGLTWQVIDSQASVADLLETPVLFISGTRPLHLAPAEKEALRQYVTRGGFVFAEACSGQGCDGAGFLASFRELMAELFPDGPLRVLPAEHPLWFADQKINFAALPHGGALRIEGVEACCRTSVVLSNMTLSCYWELYEGTRESSLPPRVRAQAEAAMQLGQNVIAYATNFQLKNKLERPRPEGDAPPPTNLQRATLVVASLAHDGGAAEAPEALPNLLRAARKQLELRALTRSRLVPPDAEQLAAFPVVFMHGRRAFRWSDPERAALRTYLDNGGFLFINSICASKPFSDAVRTELQAITGVAPRRLPPTHALFTTQYQGFDLSSVELRSRRERGEEGGPAARTTRGTPLLESIELDGRICVLFSPLDVSCALESQSSSECEGYVERDAYRVGLNVLLFALQQ